MMSVKGLFTLLCVIVPALCNEQELYRNITDDVKRFPNNSPYVRNGLPLPLPRSWKTSNNLFAVRSEGFAFNAVGMNCDDLEAAFDRYYKMIFDTPHMSEVTSNFIPLVPNYRTYY